MFSKRILAEKIYDSNDLFVKCKMENCIIHDPNFKSNNFKNNIKRLMNLYVTCVLKYFVKT